ncbi:CBASS cGAMP-activated phospholipase [Elizabethkingia anophelis]|uniref:PNPLA domain-containing protein n=1 Tax=Elizabethkingia anophelis TaxID=1117645 RepID=A0AAU8UX57_9FLAO|nr:CBASS cGAMP-activated phospholipase [Elizabethkingia anophelis]AQX01472.1 hypothetical protein BBD32_08360 [Elizabethkingia anophelis]OPB62033.1 hypothetical protein BAY11_17010 [Elizabethkingia anophelis]
MKEKSQIKILSIDGGGIRGIIPAKVLTELEEKLKVEFPEKKLYEHFDLICGTSTGAILAIGIALGIPTSKLLNFYKSNAKIIFPKWFLKILPSKIRVMGSSMYSNKSLRNKLKEVYTEANGGVEPLMLDLKTNVCIPTFNGGMGEINILKTKHNPEYSRDYKLPAHQVALSSASAPVYFPPNSFSYKNNHGEGHNINMIDGGVFANNPSLIGILEATDKMGYEFSQIKLLSLGTGRGKHVIKSNWKAKDLWYWLIPKPRLLDIILDSQAQITEQYIDFFQRTLKDQSFNYLRVQYDLGNDTIDLNESGKKQLIKLESIGEELSKKNLSKIINFLK